ncbi:non-receptor serine/threonine protein kinase [Lithospermum erythrorhizon]|uniref:non-specific serine/threonine protein kinase n=1 Tax=Lithospermum erythrorhizon TaxID=34254 RepID=A0AAV3PM85_LITER
MWRLKPFIPKEQNGLEGRTIEVSNLKIQVRNVIAEGGFSCVYLARDLLNGSKQYALKHIICNDVESLELVDKEISVMKSLKGHPNIVTLLANSVFDMGRTKEAILVMEYCEKSLVSVLESRGAAYFEEKKILAIFRDVCNAVFAMHCQFPPIAHRDLKAENLLLGPDGLWKLCDFGSTSTNHKRFEKPEEMGVEEDIIRKHTTPAYRSPEMWDLYRKDTINEKVDIWALGCLLFRICYFKSAFDGESKLQVLNGNYRIPDLPKYSTHITDLIRDMLHPSPEARPDITQVWFRVNDLLPDGVQKSLPDRPPELQQHSADAFEGSSKPGSKSSPIPRRSPPPPPVTESARQVSPASQNSRTSGDSGPAIGAFWTTQHAHDSFASRVEPPPQKSTQGKPADGPTEDFEINFFQEGTMSRPKASNLECKPAYQNDSFNDFAAEFRTDNPSPESNTRHEALLKAEVEKLKEQLAQANIEKAEATSKYEKLAAICRSQRQEIQELKQTVAARTPSPIKGPFKAQASPSSQSSITPPQREKIEGTVWELQQGLFDQGTPSPDPKLWNAFSDNPKPQTTSTNDLPKSVRTKNGHPTRQSPEVNSQSSSWGFESESFTAIPTATSQINVPGSNLGGNSKRFGENRDKMTASQPAGWAGF